MELNKTDNIDLELSKVYFKNRNNLGTQTSDTIKSSKSSFHGDKQVIIYSSLAVLIALILALFYFLISNKRMVFNINLDILPPQVTEEKDTAEISTDPPEIITPLKQSFNPSPSYIPSISVNDNSIIFDFEKGTQGWELPVWALDKTDYVGRDLSLSDTISNSGSNALELYAEFPGNVWTAAIVELEQYLDLYKYDRISCQVYIPPYSPAGIRGRIILTAGEKWTFVEMGRSIKLTPGEWTTLSASIIENSMDWKRTVIDAELKKDIRKLAVRIESNRVKYSGPVFLDNVTITRQNKP